MVLFEQYSSSKNIYREQKGRPTMNDYYATLGVLPNATLDEIKTAFRRLANEHHPDHGGKEEKFKKINEAHEILSDSDKREEYDCVRSVLTPGEDAPILKPQADGTTVCTFIVKPQGILVMGFTASFVNVEIVIGDSIEFFAPGYRVVTVRGTLEKVEDFIDLMGPFIDE